MPYKRMLVIKILEKLFRIWYLSLGVENKNIVLSQDLKPMA